MKRTEVLPGHEPSRTTTESGRAACNQTVPAASMTSARALAGTFAPQPQDDGVRQRAELVHGDLDAGFAQPLLEALPLVLLAGLLRIVGQDRVIDVAHDVGKQDHVWRGGRGPPSVVQERNLPTVGQRRKLTDAARCAAGIA